MPSLLDFLLEHESSFRKTRLPSLYSDLSIQRANNSEGYAANRTAWTSALTLLALSGKLPTEQRLLLTTNDKLLSALSSPQYGRPVGLGAVIDDDVRSGQLLDLKDFTTSDKPIYSKSWLPSPRAILKWSLRTAGLIGSGSYDVSGRLREGQLVVIPALETVSEQVMVWQQSLPQNLTDRIYTRETFASEVSKLLDPPQPPFTKEDIRTLLMYLSRDNPILTYNEKAVKFKSPTSTTPEPITAEDESIANLKSLVEQLSVSISQLSVQVTTSQQKAATSLANKNRPLALSALRSKKLAEKQLEQRTATLNQLEDVFTQIQNAADQVTIVSTLKSSSAVLKSLNKQVGSVDDVDAVMDDLREEVSKTSEVGGVLKEGLSGEAELAEGELDDELQEMEREERENVEAAEKKEKEERDQKEAAQKEEKENKEAEESLERRFAALDKVPNGVPVGQSQVGQGDMDVEEELAKSVEKLDELRLSDAEKGKEDERVPQATGTT